MNPAENNQNLSDAFHRSPGITAIYNELKSSKRNNILDLGSSSAGSFTFFSQLSCHIHFEGVDSFLEDCGEAWSSAEKLREGLEDYLSAFGVNKKFDIILAWDIFNYFDRDTLQWFVAQLNQHCHTNTLLHMIKYVGRNIPATPQRYQIIDQYHVKSVDSDALCSRPFPNLDTTTTLRSMPGYVMEHTYMQQEGMPRDITEHVLRYLPDGKGTKRREASAGLTMTPADLPHAAQMHRSYGLERICTHLRELQDATVLDLGSKATHSGDFFLGHAENVYVEDMMPSLMTPSNPHSGEAHIRQHALRYAPNVKFDVILAWDLLSYCTRPQLAEIYQRLLPHIHAETRIFTFFYAGAELPARPQKCYVLDEKSIALLPAPKRAASAEDLMAIALLNVFRDFHLVNTYILQPGMQRGVYEYIFQVKDAVICLD